MQTRTTMAMATLLLSACSASPPAQPPAHAVGIANPASVYCIQQGGKLRMEHTAQGTHAMCILPNGQEVEEWDYFRKNHPTAP